MGQPEAQFFLARYRFAGVGIDFVYLEGPRTVQELRTIGKAFTGVPLAVSILEGGGKTPVLPPDEFLTMGFTMLLYPTTVLFRVTRAIQRALEDLRDGKPLPADECVDFEAFEAIVDKERWAAIEKRFGKG